jgi:hypothetical protein
MSAPLAHKTANAWTRVLVPGDDLFQGGPVSDDPDSVIVDLDPVQT